MHYRVDFACVFFFFFGGVDPTTTEDSFLYLYSGITPGSAPGTI